MKFIHFKFSINGFVDLKRFSATCYGQKLSMMVDCPMTLSSVSEFTSSSCSSMAFLFIIPHLFLKILANKIYVRTLFSSSRN